MPRRALLTALSLLLACTQTPVAPTRVDIQFTADVKPPKQLALAIDRDVEAAIADEQMIGLGVAIVFNKHLVFARGYGFADLDRQISVGSATRFRIASISKTITAALALALSEAGTLDLDAPIQRYVPSFPQKQAPITARQLLGHLSGIRHYKGSEMLSTRRYNSVIEPLDLFKDDPLQADPGSKFVYSSHGYNLLGAAIEVAGGKSYEKLAEEFVFKPGDMKHSQTEDSSKSLDKAVGYERSADGVLEPAPVLDPSSMVPSDGMLSTASDLGHFAIALMEAKILSPQDRDEMWTVQKTRDGEPTQYGLGWALGSWRGTPTALHTGSQPGATTSLWIEPERGCAVVLLSNTSQINLEPLTHQLADDVCK